MEPLSSAQAHLKKNEEMPKQDFRKKYFNCACWTHQYF